MLEITTAELLSRGKRRLAEAFSIESREEPAVLRHETDAHMLSAQISSETDTVVSPAAPAGLRPMRAARSAKSGMRTAVARP